MPIKVGDRLPNATFTVMTAEGPKPKTTDDIFKGKGVDTIAVTGVNDVFVMDAWKKASGGDAIEFLADGSGNFAKAMGLTADLTERGLGVRSQRYAMVVQDGVVKALTAS